MAVKRCCIENCLSQSTREEDKGVTYHKFPKELSFRDVWLDVTHSKTLNTHSFVCSRHFRKKDFLNKESIYILKSDAVPSIFPWTITNMSDNMESSQDTDEREDESTKAAKRSRDFDNENLDNIKKFIQDQETNDDSNNISTDTEDKSVSEMYTDGAEAENKIESIKEELKKESSMTANETKKDKTQELSETLAVASSVMDMILQESENKISEKKCKPLNMGEKGNNSLALSVGSKVEAKDFGEDWHPAQILEVDYDEMEVLVHYENQTKRHDEWISVSSPRLRPLGSQPATPSFVEKDQTNTKEEENSVPIPENEVKTEEKPRLLFVVGERCLARWRDNKRFMATVTNDLGDGHYEIMFDDGFKWKCKSTRLYKMKETGRNNDQLSIDTALTSISCSPSPVPQGGVSNPPGTSTFSPPFPAYHNHLFDPTRDYLGSKSERRAMKRKLNIKEIFNIGQKKKRVDTPKVKMEPKVKIEKTNIAKEKPKIALSNANVKSVKLELVKTEVKVELPAAVASIIGTIAKDESNEVETSKETATTSPETELKQDSDHLKEDYELNLDEPEEDKVDLDPVEEEIKLEKFEKQDEVIHEQVIDKIKEAIIKLEDGLQEVERVGSPKIELKKQETVEEEPITPSQDLIEIPIIEMPAVEEPKIHIEPSTSSVVHTPEKSKLHKKMSKVKKTKKFRLMQEKKVKKQVEKVKSELEAMKKQVEEMRKQMMKNAELPSSPNKGEMPESFLLPGEWCCKWVNGQPVGTVSELEPTVKLDIDKPALPRKSVQVEDKRLPPGWTKHMVRRSYGHSAGKWDVVLISSDSKKLHNKTDMRSYIENSGESAKLRQYEYALFDFGVHLKLSRRMGWVAGDLDPPLPAKQRRLSLKKDKKLKTKKRRQTMPTQSDLNVSAQTDNSSIPIDATFDGATLEDGYVFVGSLKVQVIENLLRCPAEGCVKNFRNNTLLKMHIKHYHRELRKMLGATPKVLDLASARTKPNQAKINKIRRQIERKVIKVKLPKLPKRTEERKSEVKEMKPELKIVITPIKNENESIQPSLDSPKQAPVKPVKRPKVLLPVRRSEPAEEAFPIELPETELKPSPIDPVLLEPLDFETAISTHTVTKPIVDIKKKEKKKSFASLPRLPLSEDEWAGINSDFDTRSSFPRSGTPDSKYMDSKMDIFMQPVSSESNEEQKDMNMYTYNEYGERIKIVRMKREEIINCHCGVREEDGLMVQCELCLCWQHALCHNIHKESEVPEKYTCSICLNPRRGRRSQRFLHDQDRMYEGLLPGAKPCETLRRSHELSGNLLRIQDTLHALRVKYYVATKKDHPKLYLWAKDWETELSALQHKLNSDYSDLNIMISDIGKENLPMKDDIRGMHLDTEDDDRFMREGQLGSQSLLSGLLSSPGGGSLDLPISTTELERLAKSVQEQEVRIPQAPQPEEAIENSTCRVNLLRHIQRCQALIDSRLDSIEAQVAELESQDPSFEDDETAEYFPRTKQTIQMLMRDLDTMEELGVIT